jgi:hypothetical protein
MDTSVGALGALVCGWPRPRAARNADFSRMSLILPLSLVPLHADAAACSKPSHLRGPGPRPHRVPVGKNRVRTQRPSIISNATTSRPRVRAAWCPPASDVTFTLIEPIRLRHAEEKGEGTTRGQSWFDDYDPSALAGLVLLVGICSLALLGI